jgi:DNA-binding transcriptional MerR regulator
MNNSLTISQLGEKVGLTTKTIRFYEEIKLIDPAKRAENGYRMYDASIIEDLQLIKYARDLGLPIEKIRKLMKGCADSCEHTKQEIQSEIKPYIELLDEKILQLTTLRTKLLKLSKNIEIEEDCDNNKYCCNVLHQLSNLEKEVKI